MDASRRALPLSYTVEGDVEGSSLPPSQGGCLADAPDHSARSQAAEGNTYHLVDTERLLALARIPVGETPWGLALGRAPRP